MWTAGRVVCLHCRWEFDALKHYGTPNNMIECPRCEKADSVFVDFKQLRARIERCEKEEHW